MKRTLFFRLLLASTLVFSTAARAQDLSSIDIAHEKYVLDNGLTLLVHEDRSAPQVFVAVYYKVGSRDEEPGKTGFAHLFEHLMFNGSENHDREYFEPIQDVGGSVNGDTWFDRTRYYQTVPSTALERVLWLESDRMGHLLGAITQEKLDQQRGVVQNEKRRFDNAPYGLLGYRQLEGLFPKGHPYRWSTIGSMADLNAASLDDVHTWFKTYYGAANTILVVGGDVDPADVLASVELHFGDIPAGAPVARLDDWVPVRTANTFEVMQDRAPNPLLTRNWVAPGRDHRDSALLLLAAQILGGDETSRLYKALVKDSGLAVEVSLSAQAHDLASMPSLSIVLKPDTDPAAVRSIVDAEFRRFFADGPTREELALIKTAIAASVIKGLDSLTARAVRLAESEFYLGAPDAYKISLSWIDEATRADVQAAAARWLGDGYHEILVEPFGPHQLAETGADRSALPGVAGYPSAKAPPITDHVLSNGIQVRFVRREGVPAVAIGARLQVGRAGAAGTETGVYDMTVAMLDKGTRKRSAEDIKTDLKRTGSGLSVQPSADETRVVLTTLTSKIDGAAELLADVLRNPSFDAGELEILKEQTRTDIAFDKSTPSSLVRRYASWKLFGDGHPYGLRPVEEADVDAVTAGDLRSFHARWFRPAQVTLVAVGGIDEKTLLASLEASFGNWKAAGSAPALANTRLKPARTKTKVVLFDTPGAPQSNILAARQIEAAFGPDHESLQLANSVYGGTFTSRINMNLREEKGWSYGVGSGTSGGVGTRSWRVSAQVQTDKTAATIDELRQELAAISADKPFTPDELEAVRNQTVRGLPRATTTANGVLGYVMNLLSHGHPDDFIETRKAAYDAVTVPSMTAALRKHVSADELVWFIAGDIAKIEDEVRALDLGPVEIWDADGQRLR